MSPIKPCRHCGKQPKVQSRCIGRMIREWIVFCFCPYPHRFTNIYNAVHFHSAVKEWNKYNA